MSENQVIFTEEDIERAKRESTYNPDGSLTPEAEALARKICNDNIKGIKRFNRRTKIWVIGENKTKLIPKQCEETVYFDTIFRAYEVKIGEGNRHKIVFLNGKDSLQKGDTELFLTPLKINSDKNHIELIGDSHCSNYDLATICKPINVQAENKEGVLSREELIRNLIDAQVNSNNTLLFKRGIGVPFEELKKIPDFLNLVQYTINSNLEKDDLLDYVFSIFVPEISSALIKPETYMPHSPHSIIITNSKVGKTSAAAIVGVLLERPTEANLLGYGTANERISGALDSTTKSFFFDEIQEEKDESCWGKLHTYMETGSTKIARGMGVSVEGHASITFMGNPKINEEEKKENNLTDYQKIQVLDTFVTTLKKITKNYKAFGSRIAIGVFRTDLKEAKGVPFSESKKELLHAIIYTISEGFKEEFTKLFQTEPIRKWLHSSLPDKYIQNLLKVKKKIVSREISEFIDGHIESYRHTRGAALRLAWLEQLTEHISNQDNIYKILELADKHFNKILSINLESFMHIAAMEDSPEFMDYIVASMQQIKPTYLQIFFYNINEWYIKNSGKRMAVIEELSGFYNAAKQVFGDVGKYDNFFKVKTPTLENRDKSNEILYPFGLKISEVELVPAVFIDNISRFERFHKLYLEKIKISKEESTSTKRTFSTDSNYNTSTNSTKSTSTESYSINNSTENEIIRFIKSKDEGAGVITQEIINALKDESKIMTSLNYLKQVGDIFEFKPDFWKVL